MNLLETLIALMIAAGVIATAVEVSHLSQSRTLLARIELEAVVRAEALLAAAGTEIPLRRGRLDGVEGDTIQWSLDMQRDEEANAPPEAFQVTADVVVAREGATARQRLTTLKLVGER